MQVGRKVANSRSSNLHSAGPALLVALIVLWAFAVAAQSPLFVETAVFVSGQGGYNTYRIPALVRTTNGTLLALLRGPEDLLC
jgi:hypothetical protein